MSATRFGATATVTTTVGNATTSIGTKPAGYHPRTLVIRIPPPSTVNRLTPLDLPALFVSILPPASVTSDSALIHVHDLYQGDSNKQVTYRSKTYELRFIAVQKGGKAPVSIISP